ncbi:hypothetical protein Tco_0562298 [Tanacetum coccineum]
MKRDMKVRFMPNHIYTHRKHKPDLTFKHSSNRRMVHSQKSSKKQDNSDYVCINRDDCMSSDNLCVSNSMNDVKFRAKPKKNKSKKDIWKPTGKETKVLDSESPKPVVKWYTSRKPEKDKNTEVVQIVLWYLDSGCSKHMTGDRSQLTNFISKFLVTYPSSAVCDLQAPEGIAPIPVAVAPEHEHAVSTGSPSSTTVDQDAPSPSNSPTTQETQTPIISHDVEEDNHDI